MKLQNAVFCLGKYFVIIYDSQFFLLHLIKINLKRVLHSVMFHLKIYIKTYTLNHFSEMHLSTVEKPLFPTHFLILI